MYSKYGGPTLSPRLSLRTYGWYINTISPTMSIKSSDVQSLRNVISALCILYSLRIVFTRSRSSFDWAIYKSIIVLHAYIGHQSSRGQVYSVVTVPWYSLGLPSLLMAIISLSILYIIQRRATFLLPCRFRQLRLRSISLTLEVFICLLVTYLGARRWTISNFCILVCVYGSQTMLAYSTRDRTRVKYACCLIESAPVFRFLLRKPIVRFAL